MIRAPQLDRRRRQDDACLTRCWSVGTAGHVQGRIKLDAFQRSVTVAGTLREIPEHASPNAGAAS
jgi:hypothetical protein